MISEATQHIMKVLRALSPAAPPAGHGGHPVPAVSVGTRACHSLIHRTCQIIRPKGQMASLIQYALGTFLMVIGFIAFLSSLPILLVSY